MAKGLPRFLICAAIVLLLATPAYAGTRDRPEIIDAPDDSRFATPDRNAAPQIDITRAWIRPVKSDLMFAIEVAAAETVPKNAAYVWHFTPEGPGLQGVTRFFFRANWSADGAELQSVGGTYQGARGAVDENGNSRYNYYLGAVQDDLRHEFKPGSPATIKFYYPLDKFGDDRRGLAMKGLFVTTYLKNPETEVPNMIDYAAAIEGNDYVHKVDTPWYAKFLPGPSVLFVVAAAGAVVAYARRRQDA
ncbi:MAG: hypothetical protein KY455_06595 [Euryarchaeota archaeon]|nr:hypothetical protein [Euryarchaeota archaeon]